MKLTESNYQLAVKVGGLLLFLCAAGNLYLLLRYREVYRDASRVDAVVAQEGGVLVSRQQLLESLIREFAARAQNDRGVAEIFERHQLGTNTTALVKP